MIARMTDLPEFTSEQYERLAKAHIRHFEKLLHSAYSGDRAVRADECEAYLSIWTRVLEKRGKGLAEDELGEVRDAYFSGDYEHILGEAS